MLIPALEIAIWIPDLEVTTAIQPAAMKLELAFPRLPAVVRWVKPGVLLVSCALL